MTSQFESLSIETLDAVTGGGSVNWANAAAQCGIWGTAGGLGAVATGVGAPGAWASAGIGCAAGASSSIVSDLLSK